jgi:hypothetical protein
MTAAVRVAARVAAYAMFRAIAHIASINRDVVKM